jgi:hypothetical protein
MGDRLSEALRLFSYVSLAYFLVVGASYLALNAASFVKTMRHRARVRHVDYRRAFESRGYYPVTMR